MKLCWDMLEGVWLTRNGTFRKGRITYIYKDACANCGESYLTLKSKQSNFCGQSCAISGENGPMYGKKHTAEAKKMMSESSSGKFGDLNPNWKGSKAGFAIYKTSKTLLCSYEDIRKKDRTELLEVKCAYCGRWFSPTSKAVCNRVDAINHLNRGEGRLYCSENCKHSCPTYKRRKYPKDFKKGTSREVSTYLRQMVFERDNWECQKCGKTGEGVTLHCHHIKGYAQNKMLANDIDNCITLCKECHKGVHKQRGCRYVDLQCGKEVD